MITLKSREEVEKLRAANQIVAEVMARLGEMIAAGVTTGELDRVAEEHIRGKNAAPAFPTVPGYNHTLCVSINEEVVHGIPGRRELKEGDIVSIDCGVLLDGFFGDHAWTFGVGRISDDAEKLLKSSKEALDRGIEASIVGNRLYDISAAIESVASEGGFSVVREYVGHGIGRELHEEPQVPNFGTPGTGMKLRRGLCLALEPMLNFGGSEVEVLEDGWTVVTKDRKLSAHFEHSIAIMDEGPEILSRI